MTTLEKVRKSKGLSRAELSKLSGVPARTIENYEYGSRKMISESVLKLAKALSISLDDIVK